MKLTTALCFLCLSYYACALEKNTGEQPLTVEANIHQQGLGHDFTINYGAIEFKTHYSIADTLRMPVVLSTQKQINNFYLHSELIVHSSTSFNLSMSANICHTNSVSNIQFTNHQTTHNFTPVNWISYQVNSNKDLEPYYSLIGHYNISSQWKLSGGILFTHFSNLFDDSNNFIEQNNVALIKTSYRF